MRPLFRFGLLVCGAAIALSGCGNKGDLVMPPTKTAPPPAPTVPANDPTSKPATSP